MKFHKIKMIGKYWMQDVSSLPSWAPEDEGRLVYQNTDETVYYGTSTGWAAVGSGGGGSQLNIDRQEFQASAGQTIFTLSFNYTLSSNGLIVYADNMLMIKNVDYYETDSNTITFITGRAQDEEITVLNVSTNASIQRVDVVSTLSQTVFNLPFSYVVGSNDLLVFSNNMMMIKGGVDYTETDPTTITFATGRASSETITFMHLGTSGEINTGTNIGATGQLGYAGKSGTTLQFRKLDSCNGLVTSIVSDTIMTEPNFLPLTTFPGTPASNDYFIMRRNADGLYYKVPGSTIGGDDGGFDMSYIPITATSDQSGNLTFNQTGSATNSYLYTLANFSGVGISSTEIRGIFVSTEVRVSGNNVTNAEVQALYPDGSTVTIQAKSISAADDDGRSNATFLIPISPSQSSITLTLVTTDNNAYAEFTILGAWQRIAASIQFFAPIGTILPFSGPSGQVPSNALLCHGQAISRTSYSELFAVIGTTYGSGDGSATFNVPDLRGRSILGLDNMGGSDANRIDSSVTPNRSSDTWAEDLGGNAGEDQHTLTEAEMPSHIHSTLLGQEGGASGSGSYDPPTYPPTDVSVDTDSTGGDQPHNNVQPSMAMNWIIIASLDPQMPTGNNLARGWANFSYSGGILTVNDSYNVASITRVGAGIYDITWLITFANANYSLVGSTEDNGSEGGHFSYSNKTASTIRVYTRKQINPSSVWHNSSDSADISCVAYGEQ